LIDEKKKVIFAEGNLDAILGFFSADTIIRVTDEEITPRFDSCPIPPTAF
jgi:UDP-2,3-diacylglucosamine pyrophosphatase LpxH